MRGWHSTACGAARAKCFHAKTAGYIELDSGHSSRNYLLEAFRLSEAQCLAGAHQLVVDMPNVRSAKAVPGHLRHLRTPAIRATARDRSRIAQNETSRDTPPPGRTVAATRPEGRPKCLFCRSEQRLKLQSLHVFSPRYRRFAPHHYH